MPRTILAEIEEIWKNWNISVGGKHENDEKIEKKQNNAQKICIYHKKMIILHADRVRITITHEKHKHNKKFMNCHDELS